MDASHANPPPTSMASVGAGRRQGEGVQVWAPVEEAEGRAGRSPPISLADLANALLTTALEM
jgi:hypothetical protein